MKASNPWPLDSTNEAYPCVVANATKTAAPDYRTAILLSRKFLRIVRLSPAYSSNMKVFLPLVLAAAFVLPADADSLADSKEMSVQLYPDLRKEGSPLHNAIKARIESERAAASAIFENPNWPLYLAVSEAVKLGIQPHFPSATSIKQVNSKESERQSPLDEINWALSLNGPRTTEEARRQHEIFSKYGGQTPEGRARLVALVSGANLQEIEAISQTEELKRKNSELIRQSDTLDALFEVQRTR